MKGLALGTATLPIVLVVPDQTPPGVVTRLCVHASRTTQEGGPVLQVVGDHWLDSLTQTRWVDTLIPHVHSALTGLGVVTPNTIRWRVALRVPDAVVLSGRPCRLEGTSADAAFLALLIASAFGIRTRPTTLLTGAVQLDDERLGLVGCLPEKLDAAADDPAIRRFIHPPIDRDGSGAWTPEALLHWDEACHQCDHRIKRRACTTIAGAVKAALSPDSRVIAAIRHGFFMTSYTAPESPTSSHNTGDTQTPSIPVWAYELRQIDEARWLEHLDRRIHAGRKPASQRLLEARLEHAIQNGRYPHGIGATLRSSLETVPIGRRRAQLSGQLIGAALMDAVMDLAGTQDHDDAMQLMIATGHTHTTHGDLSENANSSSQAAVFPGSPSGVLPGAGVEDNASPEDKLAWLIDSQRDQAVAERIEQALDTARLSFQVQGEGPWQGEAFIDLIASFYAHLYRYTGQRVSPDRNQLAAAAMSLLDRAYARDGGYKTALANARDHTQGGLRRVLDAMTDTLKLELRRADTLIAHLLAIDGRDFDASLAQARSLVEKFGPLLPQKFRGVPPEFLVGELEHLVGEAVQTGDRLVQRLRNH